MDNKCHALTSKKTQCNNPQKKDQIYCGTHLKMLLLNKSFDSITIPKDIPQNTPKEIPKDIPKDTPKNTPKDTPKNTPKDTFDDIPEDISKDIPGDWSMIREYLSKDEKLFEREDLEYIGKYIGYSKGNMKEYAKNYLRFNTPKILTIQRSYRRHLARRIYGPTIFNQKISYNDTELINCIPINEIPLEYYFSYEDNNKYYTFDIRCLIEIISEAQKDNKDAKNPYSQRLFTKQFYDNYGLKMKFLKGINLKYDECELTPEQKYDQEVFDTFKEIDKLGNYTNYKWYTSLDLNGYQELYKKLRKIWQIYQGSKKDIVPPDGKVFTNTDEGIKIIKNVKLLRKFVLDEFKKLIYSGKTLDDRKMGSWLFLSALVGVSFDAAHAMPHLVGQF